LIEWNAPMVQRTAIGEGVALDQIGDHPIVVRPIHHQSGVGIHLDHRIKPRELRGQAVVAEHPRRLDQQSLHAVDRGMIGEHAPRGDRASARTQMVSKQRLLIEIREQRHAHVVRKHERPHPQSDLELFDDRSTEQNLGRRPIATGRGPARNPHIRPQVNRALGLRPHGQAAARRTGRYQHVPQKAFALVATHPPHVPAGPLVDPHMMHAIERHVARELAPVFRCEIPNPHIEHPGCPQGQLERDRLVERPGKLDPPGRGIVKGHARDEGIRWRAALPVTMHFPGERTHPAGRPATSQQSRDQREQQPTARPLG
jgi:hypothetical protein